MTPHKHMVSALVASTLTLSGWPNNGKYISSSNCKVSGRPARMGLLVCFLKLKLRCPSR